MDQALSEAEDRILYRLRPFPQANADKLLMDGGSASDRSTKRADCRSNGAIGFRRVLLARKKMQLLGLTNRQTEYPYHKLSQMLEELCRADAHTSSIYF